MPGCLFSSDLAVVGSAAAPGSNRPGRIAAGVVDQHSRWSHCRRLHRCIGIPLDPPSDSGGCLLDFGNRETDLDALIHVSLDVETSGRHIKVVRLFNLAAAGAFVFAKEGREETMLYLLLYFNFARSFPTPRRRGSSWRRASRLWLPYGYYWSSGRHGTCTMQSGGGGFTVVFLACEAIPKNDDVLVTVNDGFSLRQVGHWGPVRPR